jgi:hypothetical protein
MGAKNNETSDHIPLPIPFIVALCVALLVIIILFVSLLVYFLIYGSSFDNSRMSYFLSSAAWIQAFIYVFNLIVMVFTLTYVVAVREQLKSDQNRTKREIYRKLISRRIISTRGSISTKAVKGLLQELDRSLSGKPLDHDAILSDFRSRIDSEGAKHEFPLIPGEHASLAHIELLLNEYNYIFKLISDGLIGIDFTTAMSKDNFILVYDTLLPFIRLRRGKSLNYASHFTDYCKDMAPTRRVPGPM